MADIPGLLEGAHEGVGLGLEFLRHVERTKVLVHVVDGGVEGPVEEYRKVRNELAQYSQDLMAKPEIIAINKVDLPSVAAMCEGVKKELGSGGAEVHCISAMARQGISDLLDGVVQALRKVTASTEPRRGGRHERDVPPVIRPQAVAVEATVKKVEGAFLVSHSGAERIAAMVDPGNPAATTQLYAQLRKLGVIAALERAGINPGDVFRVGKSEWEWG
jgi:GTP-binding protein